MVAFARLEGAPKLITGDHGGRLRWHGGRNDGKLPELAVKARNEVRPRHTSYDETILPTSSVNGGRSRCGYDDGCGGGAPARTARGTGAYRASSASNAGMVGLRGHYVASVVIEGR